MERRPNLGFNVADWLTGWMKSRMMHKENSMAGWKGVLKKLGYWLMIAVAFGASAVFIWKGVLKKLGYWLMIAVAFGASAVFIEIGTVLHIDLQITTLLGWFVLASLLVNEIRSICENFVEAGFNVPNILIKGLEVADKKINNSEGE